jgi:hypothetical protein
MLAPALAAKLVAPGCETEFGRLLVQVADLPPAARGAVADVVLSLVAEGNLEQDAVESALALLDELGELPDTSAPPPRQHAQAARRRAAALRQEARAVVAEAAVQRRRSRRLAQARRVCP